MQRAHIMRTAPEPQGWQVSRALVMPCWAMRNWHAIGLFWSACLGHAWAVKVEKGSFVFATGVWGAERFGRYCGNHSLWRSHRRTRFACICVLCFRNVLGAERFGRYCRNRSLWLSGRSTRCNCIYVVCFKRDV